jgi:hypothetical protein
MPAIVTAAELRAILGVSVSLYSDAQLNSYIDSAEQTILPLLTQYQSSVTFANVDESVIYFTTMRPNYFVPGQSVVVTGAGTYSATYTVTDDDIYGKEEGVRSLKRTINDILSCINMMKYIPTDDIKITFPFCVDSNFYNKYCTKFEHKQRDIIWSMYT